MSLEGLEWFGEAWVDIGNQINRFLLLRDQILNALQVHKLLNLSKSSNLLF